MTSKQAGEKLGAASWRINCSRPDGHIPGAVKTGTVRLIPENAKSQIKDIRTSKGREKIYEQNTVA